MGRKLHYIPGSFYQTDDRTGFPQRAGRMRSEWDGLIVARDVWEPRQPQDLVKGVRDNQNVDNARPLPPDVFVGPQETILADTVLVQGGAATLQSTFGFNSGDTISVMLDNGVPFLVYIYIDFGVPGGIVFSAPIPYQASSGNVVYNYGPLFAPPASLLLNDGGVLQLVSGFGYPSSPAGLPAGAVWNNGLTVAIVPGTIPAANAPPLYFRNMTVFALLALGGGNLPLTSPSDGSGQLWNNGGEVAIA